MSKILFKIRNLILNKIKEIKVENNYRRIAGKTKELRQRKKSDFSRWAKQDELHDNWNERTFLLSELVKENSRVIEFGAGNMSLEENLPSGCSYQGSDLVKRFPDMIVCDLNEGINFSLSKYDTAVFSGVLEYVYDIDKIFSQLRTEITTVIMSYCCKDQCTVNRLRMGWLSDYSQNELEEIFHRNGFQVKEYRQWKNQSIYKLNRN